MESVPAPPPTHHRRGEGVQRLPPPCCAFAHARARSALLSPGDSGAAKGVFAGLDHLPFYTEGLEGGVESRIIPNRDRYPTLPVDPRIPLKTHSTQEDTGRSFRQDTSCPGAIRSASVPTSSGRWSGRLGLWEV